MEQDLEGGWISLLKVEIANLQILSQPSFAPLICNQQTTKMPNARMDATILSIVKKSTNDINTFPQNL